MLIRLVTGAVSALVIAAPAAAVVFPTPVTPVALGSTSYTQNFNTLASTGTSSALPAGWQIREEGTNADGTYLASTGSDTAGTSYSFGSSGSSDRALGSIGSGSLSPIYYGAFFTNALSSAIDTVGLSFRNEQWRRGNSTDERVTFEYSLNATSLSDGTWTAVSLFDLLPVSTTGAAGATDGNAIFQALSGTIDVANIAVGGRFAIRWTDVNSGGNDYGLAIDDLALTLTPVAATPAVPEPATWATMIGGFGLVGGALRRRRAGALRLA
jgi:hypothetical protein